jgi:hypothetical protein
MEIAGASGHGAACGPQQQSAVRNKLAAQLGRRQPFVAGARPPEMVPMTEARSATMQTIPETEQGEKRVENATASPADGESLHEVLATRARDRTTLELTAGALVGAVNAAVIWLRFPSAHWLAAGFAATMSHALWGLADRELSLLNKTLDATRFSRILMRFVRFGAGAAGWIAAIFAIATFLTAGLGGLSLPGR